MMLSIDLVIILLCYRLETAVLILKNKTICKNFNQDRLVMRNPVLCCLFWSGWSLGGL